MTDYRIGKVSAVSGDQVFVSLLDPVEDGSAGVPASMTVDMPSADGPVPLLHDGLQRARQRGAVHAAHDHADQRGGGG